LTAPPPVQSGADIVAPGSQNTVIGLELDPDPCTVNGELIVPHRSTVTPGPIFPAPEPQSEALLKNDTALASAQSPPLPLPPPL
ncbi:MAG: hypothetical protein WB557_23320, partial [Solirubrobacteraceae bacterium]